MGMTYTLGYSRMLYGHEILVAYNVSASPRSDHIVVDATLHKQGDEMKFLDGGTGSVPVDTAPDGTCFVRLDLDGRKFVILE
jgi:hypothetical protein